ncbi:MAG TPA: hypothetical protein VGO47_13855 [Chlamydiales bacterium]|nr:hypothetical protein [Chlamydiales bacterium]
MVYSTLCVLSFILLHPTNTVAQSFFPSTSPDYFAPPIDTGTLAINAVMAFFTLVELGILISYLFRGKRGHMSSAAVLIVGTVFLIISYVLNMVSVLAIFTTWGEKTFTASNFLSLTDGWFIYTYKLLILKRFLAFTLFKQWSDPVVLMAISCIVRDRYVAWNNSKGVRSHIPLVVVLLFVLFVLLTLMILILDSAYVGAMANTRPERFTSETLAALLDHLVALTYAREAFYILSGIVMLGFCIHLKRISSSDSVRNHPHIFMGKPFQILFLDREHSRFWCRSSRNTLCDRFCGLRGYPNQADDRRN